MCTSELKGGETEPPVCVDEQCLGKTQEGATGFQGGGHNCLPILK